MLRGATDLTRTSTSLHLGMCRRLEGLKALKLTLQVATRDLIICRWIDNCIEQRKAKDRITARLRGRQKLEWLARMEQVVR